MDKLTTIVQGALFGALFVVIAPHIAPPVNRQYVYEGGRVLEFYKTDAKGHVLQHWKKSWFGPSFEEAVPESER